MRNDDRMIFLDGRLVGGWSGAVVNVMESTDVFFLPGGGGWSLLDSVSGTTSLSRFRWSCPAEGLLRLRNVWYVDGATGRDGRFAADARITAADDVFETRYALTRRRHPWAREDEGDRAALVVDPALDYESVFYRVPASFTAADDPSAALVPYPPAPRPGPPPGARRG